MKTFSLLILMSLTVTPADAGWFSKKKPVFSEVPGDENVEPNPKKRSKKKSEPVFSELPLTESVRNTKFLLPPQISPIEQTLNEFNKSHPTKEERIFSLKITQFLAAEDAYYFANAREISSNAWFFRSMKQNFLIKDLEDTLIEKGFITQGEPNWIQYFAFMGSEIKERREYSRIDATYSVYHTTGFTVSLTPQGKMRYRYFRPTASK